MRLVCSRLLPSLIVLTLAACGGGDDDGATADAAPDIDAMGGEPDAPVGADAAPDAQPDGGPVCNAIATPDSTLASFSATYRGSLSGAGADVTIAEGACASETGWVDQTGEDQVVVLDSLVAGTTYGVVVTSTEDVGVYIFGGCADGADQGVQDCLAFDDDGDTGEEVTFVAPASGQVVVVVDSDAALDPGAFDLVVRESECADSPDCDSGDCVGFLCATCAAQLDCDDAAAPVCSDDLLCVGGPASCVDDDAADDGNGDDGPASARSLAVPTAGSPTSATGAICSEPLAELDWFAFVVAAETGFTFDVTWTGAADLDFYIFDSAGDNIGGGIAEGTDGGIGETATLTLAAGTYYVAVDEFSPASSTATISYTVDASVAVVAGPAPFGPFRPGCGAAGCYVAGPSLKGLTIR